MHEHARNFETARTRRFRAQALDARETKTLERIEAFGCEVLHIRSDQQGPGWSFTVGVYDTCGQPEILMVGLPDDTARYVLNQAVKRLRSGIDVAAGRQSGILSEVDCEFRPVDTKWVRHLMGWAHWYYQGADFPVLQAIYPDAKNRFPGEDGFDTRFQQPLLQSDAPQTVFEEDFWLSADPNFDWKFSDPPRTLVFLSKAVNSGEEAITYVSHDAEDGFWQFLGDSMAGDDDLPVLSCLRHPIEKDASLVELADLPLGWYAERVKPGAPWIRSPKPPDEMM